MARPPKPTNPQAASDEKPAADPTVSGTEGPEAPKSEPLPAVQPFFKLFDLASGNPSDEQLKEIAREQIQYDLAADPAATQYNVLFLYDSLAITRWDTDQLYRASNKLQCDKPLLLIIDSNGGDIAAAYFIAKVCREFTNVSFEVAVPRRAKSAATLICCGADRIHMGSLSELGPIDPQFEGIPALALKNSVEHLAELTKRYPQATDLFSSYLTANLRIEALGYYERVAESAAQYAERLLRARRGPQHPPEVIKSIAERLVYMYKDHGFVIDAAEAQDILGAGVVTNTAEYALANKLYRSLDIIERLLRDMFKKRFAFTGSPDTAGSVWSIPANDQSAA